MKNKNLKKLVIALRSGKYKQGKLQLNYRNEKFCVLGVACEVAMENGVKINKKIYGISPCYYYNGQCCKLPINVVEFFNFNDQYGSYGDEDLIHKNDTAKKSFEEIADFIEKNEHKLTKPNKN